MARIKMSWKNNPQALLRLLQSPDLKYFRGLLPTVGNLRQSRPMPFLGVPQVFLLGGQRPHGTDTTQWLCIPNSSEPPWLCFTTVLLPRALPGAGSPAGTFASLLILPLHVQMSPRSSKPFFHTSPRCLYSSHLALQYPTASPPTSGSP